MTKKARSPERVEESGSDPIISTLSRRGNKWSERYQPGRVCVRKCVETNMRTYKLMSYQVE